MGDVTLQFPRRLAAHLAAGLRRMRRRYRNRFDRCQQKFSEAAVHDLRIETRRLLAMLDLLCALHFDAQVRKPRKALKRRLDAFDDLRDTQVCLGLLKPLRREFPEARLLDPLWRRRERQLIAKLRRDIKAMKQARLQKRLRSLEKLLRGTARSVPHANGQELALRALREAFAEVLTLHRRIRPRCTQTIHRTRIAFKRFRYMCELLAPLLPGVARERLEGMRAFQMLMGNIQDSEVLLAAVAVAVKANLVPLGVGRRLRTVLLRRRRELINCFLGAAADVLAFDPDQFTKLHLTH